MSSAQRNIFSSLMSSPQLKASVVHHNIDFTQNEFDRLRHDQMLNDEIINLYMELLNNQPISVGARCFSTHFLTSMRNREENQKFETAIQKKTYTNIFNKSTWIFPWNIIHTHWFIAVVDFQKKQIFLLDSLVSQENQQHWENCLKVFFFFFFSFYFLFLFSYLSSSPSLF